MKSAKDIIGASQIYFDYILHRPFFKLYKAKNIRNFKAQENIFPNIGILFIHIPKTAGNSINEALLNAERHLDVKASETAPDMGNLRLHATADEIRDRLGPETYSRYFSVAFVRNPWDLMVSSFFWWRQYGIKGIDTMYHSAIIRNMEFEEFMDSIYGRYFINEWHGEMSDWFMKGERDIVDYVGQFETMKQDMDKISEITGIPRGTVDIPLRNATDRRDYRVYYTDHSKKVVEKRFAYIIERFGYRF
jgi:hypothetical protein